MKPLTAFKPPQENEKTIPFFVAVNEALNHIDRSMYLPIETISERYAHLFDAYDQVSKTFDEQARSLGLADWLRFTIANRKFGLTCSDSSIDALRDLYDQMERLGYPSVDPLISIRMIWTNRLAENGEVDEAQRIVRQLLADIAEFQHRYPNILGSDSIADLDRFRQHHGV